MQAATFVAVLCALAFFNGAEALWLGSGECPQTVRPMQNFDLAKFTGRWFEIKRGGMVTEFNGTCIQSKYTLNHDGKVDVRIDLKLEFDGRRHLTFEGKAVLQDNSATLNVTIPRGDSYNTLFWSILDTDYENYAVVYSCSTTFKTFGTMYREEAWMLSREAQISKANLGKAESALSSNGLYTDKWTVQNDCDGIV